MILESGHGNAGSMVMSKAVIFIYGAIKVWWGF